MCESQGKRTWTRVDKAYSLKNDAGKDFAWGEARGNAGRSAWWRRRPYFCSGTFSERRHLVPGEAETIAIATVTPPSRRGSWVPGLASVSIYGQSDPCDSEDASHLLWNPVLYSPLHRFAWFRMCRYPK